ncbi:hypothetical protein A4X13_0g7220 [Tilletia indica]|uniref:Uncharacterized protein n=1 Tax=Tilletia indica TaxID=43049 RepID=A0A8T8SL45_9BASI|nr:hypothetical protein A4X13_0g7220 [Tilletia indica]
MAHPAGAHPCGPAHQSSQQSHRFPLLLDDERPQLLVLQPLHINTALTSTTSASVSTSAACVWCHSAHHGAHLREHLVQSSPPPIPRQGLLRTMTTYRFIERSRAATSGAAPTSPPSPLSTRPQGSATWDGGRSWSRCSGRTESNLPHPQANLDYCFDRGDID